MQFAASDNYRPGVKSEDTIPIPARSLVFYPPFSVSKCYQAGFTAIAPVSLQARLSPGSFHTMSRNRYGVPGFHFRSMEGDGECRKVII